MQARGEVPFFLNSDAAADAEAYAHIHIHIHIHIHTHLSRGMRGRGRGRGGGGNHPAVLIYRGDEPAQTMLSKALDPGARRSVRSQCCVEVPARY